ncbi:MAG: twin-arginine translocase TatA/TatE family subunit [Propionibacteriaceae bacterium]|nr:twin-arginine translocase TatA/TatE family subunit [Propionibacteriaceae bacterium]
MGLGWQELLIILVIVVIIFGGSKIAGVGKASGRAIREFKDEIKGNEPGKDQSQIAPKSADPTIDMRAASPADTPDSVPPGQADLR